MNQEILLKVRKSQESMKAYKEGSLLLITTKLLITAKLKGKKKLRAQYYETNRMY